MRGTLLRDGDSVTSFTDTDDVTRQLATNGRHPAVVHAAERNELPLACVILYMESRRGRGLGLGCKRLHAPRLLHERGWDLDSAGGRA